MQAPVLLEVCELRCSSNGLSNFSFVHFEFITQATVILEDVRKLSEFWSLLPCTRPWQVHTQLVALSMTANAQCESPGQQFTADHRAMGIREKLNRL